MRPMCGKRKIRPLTRTIEEFLGLFSVINFLLQFVFVRTVPFGLPAGEKVLNGSNPKHVLCPSSQAVKYPEI